MAHICIHPENQTTLVLDPHDKFSDVEPRRLLACLGYLPSFIDTGDARSLKDQLEQNYGFGCYWSDADNFDCGVFKGDKEDGEPDLEPVAFIKRGKTGEAVIFYQYALVVYLNKHDKPIYCRMD